MLLVASLLLVVRHLLLAAMHLFLLASLLLVAMPFAPNSVLVPSSNWIHLIDTKSNPWEAPGGLAQAAPMCCPVNLGSVFCGLGAIGNGLITVLIEVEEIELA